MAQIDGAGQQDTDNQNAEALQAALAQRQVTLQGQSQGGSDVPSHQNSDPVSDESEILRSCQPLTEKRRVLWNCTTLFAQLGTAGTVTCRGACTRFQSSPSSKTESSAAVSRMTPSRTLGQRNWPSSSRLATRTTPVPSQKTSQKTSLTRSADCAS